MGRDLTTTSQQDTDHYDSSQQSVSAGASFTFGAPGGSGSFSYSRDKMHSTLDSVAEQSGLFAGTDGFDVTVGNHTQLNGGAIGSTATADKNRLDTGTLGFSDIHNEADYQVSHTGFGFSSSGSPLGQLAAMTASTIISGMGGSGHAEGTTQAAVSQGSIVIRDQSHQQQDISGLQRDVTKASDTVSPIFDKEKEQKRLQTAQLISDASVQVSDVVRSEGDIAAAKAVRDPGARAAAKLALQNAGIADPSEDAITNQTRNMAQAPYGTGSAVQRGISAATAALSALSGGDLRGALTGAAAPEIAYLIGQHITDNSDSDRKNVVAGAIAHAVVNAALARLSGGDAGAAAAGAATGELVGQLAVALLRNC